VAVLRQRVSQESEQRESAVLRISQLEQKVGELTVELERLNSGGSVQKLEGEVLEIESRVSVLTAWTRSEESVILSDLHSQRTDSLIVSDFPAIFSEFGGKRFRLLLRGSRDGFGASVFHNRCNGHRNTVTVILDTKANIFGGFTPIPWESQRSKSSRGACRDDKSLRSFLFTLKNPHNVSARKFMLQPGKEAINCDHRLGPSFVGISVANDCNANTQSSTADFGMSYINNTGLKGSTFFTGSPTFEVNEIEVFEILE
jgi:hypothetical protein